MPTPAQDMYDAWKKSHDAFKRSTKKQRAEGWNILNGWRTLPKQPPMRDLTSSAGNHYQMPEDDYEEYMTFYRSAVPSELSESYKQSGRARDVQTPADYIDRAFGKNTKAKILETDGKGHILHMAYARAYQILKVTFWNNTVVAFFRVPNELAMHLFALAMSDITRPDARGIQRHILGIEFWDLIRIRGTVHGTRYKFEYVEDNNNGYSSTNTNGNLPGRPYASGKYKEVQEYSPVAERTVNELSAIKTMLEAGLSPKEAAEALDKASDKVEGMTPESIQELINAIPKRTVRKTYEELAKVNPDKYRDILRNERKNERINKFKWDAERVSQLAEKLASEGKLGPGGIEMFNNRFPNAAEQFEYLKDRKFIADDNARFLP